MASKIMYVASLALIVFGSAPLEGIASVCESANFATTHDPRRIRVPLRSTVDDSLLVLRGGTIIDGTESTPINDGIVVIQGDCIIAVGSAKEIEVPELAHRLVSTSGMYIIPGLIDLHIHLAQQWKSDDGMYTDSDAAAAIRGMRKLSALLDGGITSIRDVGTRNDVAFKLKETVEREIVDGPRVFWAGKGILARGGHGDEIRSGVSEATKGTIHSGGPYARIANGADDWKLAVREQIRSNVDFIKLFAPFSKEEVNAAIAEAHMQGFRVTVDAYGKYTTWAIEAGANSIEHTLSMPTGAIALMKMKDVGLIPTLTTYYTLLTEGYTMAGIPPGGYYHDRHRSFAMSHERNLETVRKALEADIKIGVGTDMGFAGEEHYPDVYFVELDFLKDAGMTDSEAFYSATRVGAEILGLEDMLGTLERGKLADILVIRENPLSNIKNLRQIELVIADGRVVRNLGNH